MTISEKKEQKKELKSVCSATNPVSGDSASQEILGKQIRKAPPGVPVGETVGYLVHYLHGGPVYWEPEETIIKKKGLYDKVISSEPMLVREPEPAYARIPAFPDPPAERVSYAQGEYTVEDYLALPDGMRVELIDGYFYNMASPTATHQTIAASAWSQLEAFSEQHGGPCLPFCSPLDVQLCEDDKTMVQPDVMILCKPEQQLKKGRVYGAPDFVAEVLSPSNRNYDLHTKLNKYMLAGVREYWIIDPAYRQIYAYDFESKIQPKLYTFDDQVPVAVWDKQCTIDFRKISNRLALLPEE